LKTGNVNYTGTRGGKAVHLAEKFYSTITLFSCRLRLKCDGTHAETRFRLSAEQTSLFNSAGASGQSTTGSRGVRISGSNAGYIMFRGSGKSTGYPLHSPVSKFTTPTVRHRVPSHFNWTLQQIYFIKTSGLHQNMRDVRMEGRECSCKFCYCALSFPQVTVLNGLAEFGRDYNMWLFELVISADINLYPANVEKCMSS
jgi:hypothetical protein